MFVKVTNGQPSKYPYTLGELRRDNPHTSFPKQVPDSVLAAYDVYPVQAVPAPAVDSKTHRVSQSVQNIDRTWTQVWRVLELPIETASVNVRAHRDRLLSETDWIVIMHTERGTNIPMEWEVYRQALRDITAQEGFPYSVTWPAKH